jgi:hypothetical protein
MGGQLPADGALLPLEFRDEHHPKRPVGSFEFQMHGPCCRLGRLPLLPPTLCMLRPALRSARWRSGRAVQPSAAAGPLKGGGPESHFLNNFFCSRALRASSRASYSALVPKFFLRWRLWTEYLHVVLRFAGRAPTSSPGCRNLDQATVPANSHSQMR